ncbi:MAG: hypothetical protein EA343_00105 [Nodularia sp. (in: Bacteria)]|nr:MAG: hypothetical protein EA343_00105 [Nodularia sp. (in: cyanobacteria)]
MKITKLHAALLISSMGLMGMYEGVVLAQTPNIWTSSSGVQDNTYRVEVKINGNKFDSCFKFDGNNTLTIDSNLIFTYVQDSQKRTWQAVHRQQPGVGMNGNVSKKNQGSEIKGQGINVQGGTFTFKGKFDAHCIPSGTQLGGGMMEQKN